MVIVYFVAFDFSNLIFRAMDALIETSQEGVIYLLLTLCERMQWGVQSFTLLDGTAEGLSRIQGFLRGTVSKWVGVLKGVVNGASSSTSIHEADLALLWGSINCFPQIVDSQEGLSLLFNLIDAVDQLLMIEDGTLPNVLSLTYCYCWIVLFHFIAFCCFKTNMQHYIAIQIYSSESTLIQKMLFKTHNFSNQWEKIM